ncbi:hypothetical protein FOCC_FOCC008850 [Frankliniella occidentalis]|nr:hypothetical protein FOCC_FOCC008850 [Frankliniella occidentalis]
MGLTRRGSGRRQRRRRHAVQEAVQLGAERRGRHEDPAALGRGLPPWHHVPSKGVSLPAPAGLAPWRSESPPLPLENQVRPQVRLSRLCQIHFHSISPSGT